MPQQLTLTFLDLEILDEAAEAYRLRQNRSSERSEWDEKVVQNYLRAIVERRPPTLTDPTDRIWYDVSEDIEYNWNPCPGKAYEFNDPCWQRRSSQVSRFNPVLAHYRVKFLNENHRHEEVEILKKSFKYA